MEVGSKMVLVFIRQTYEIEGAWFLELMMKDLKNIRQHTGEQTEAAEEPEAMQLW